MITSTKALDPVRRVGSDAWRPRSTVPLSQWVEDHIRLSAEWEASPGRYDLTANPFFRDILDAMQDPEVRQITLKKSTQVGGTLLLIAATIGLSELDPSPGMLVGPDELYTHELRDRLYATAEESPATSHRVPPERLRNSRHIDLDTCRWYLAWAGSAQRLRGRACKRVFRSEIDVYPPETPRGGDPLKASAERVKRFIDSKLYNESSPDGETSQIDELYKAGHQAQWYVQCPHCGQSQVLRFFTFKDGKRKGNGGIGGIRDKDGNFRSVSEVRKTAHYICIDGCKITNDEKNEMVRKGAWVAEGQRILADGQVTGEPARGRRHLSFHLWSIHSPTMSLADLAVAYLEHRRDGRLRDFFQNWLGLHFESRKALPEWHVLGKKLEMAYRRGTIPQSAWFLTAGVDVQLDGCWYVVRAWSDQATSWLIDFGFVQRFESDDIDVESLSEDEINEYFQSDIRQLEDRVCNRYYPIENGEKNPLGKMKLRPRIICIDSQFRTREVHAFVATQDERRVIAVRGDHKTKPQKRWQESIVERPRRGGPDYISPRRVLNIYTPHYKEALFEKYQLPKGVPGSFNLYHRIVKTSADYLRQLVNERPFDEIDKTTGRKKTVWRPRFSQWGNHIGDAEVYGFCGAEVLLAELDVTWDASTWTSPTQQQARATVSESSDVTTPLVAVREDQLVR